MSPSAKNTTSSSALPAKAQFGLFALHVLTALWIGYGAVVKAVEFNPLLLPPPILALLRAIVGSVSADPALIFEWSLRAIIGAEVAIALGLLLTKQARAIALVTLSLFCVILITAMVQAGMKDGLKEALAGSCGCFGEAGLPASVMLLIDGLLLLSAIFLVPKGAARGVAPLWIPVVVGAIAMVAVPKPVIETTPEQTGETIERPMIEGAWPAAPARYEVTYFPKWAEWIGKPFRSQKIALAIERPVPDDFEQGDWLVVFSRADCDHCQELYLTHFAEPRKERVLKITVPDTTGRALPMPCNGCVSATLYAPKAGSGGKIPNYMLTTPIVVRLKDGIVTDVCADVDETDDLARVLGSASAAAGTPPTPASATDPEASTETTTGSTNQTIPTPAKPVTPPAQARWPGLPAQLEPFYIADFSESTGKPLASNPFARLIAGRIPADFLSGRWIVIFYREDCDHCHEILMTYFTGQLPVRTLAVAIPDTDPAGALDNPCDQCVKMSLVKGPNYVIGTPVLVAIVDGVVECVVENAEDIPALESCLKFGGN
ncbi:MAG: hypothetical protein RL136_106 [Planctomycetota bacterium]|jgi:hypothetical protein